MKRKMIFAALVATTCAANGAEIVVTMNTAETQGAGPVLGEIRIIETAYGLVFNPTLNGLTPGFHGFHVHEAPSCAPGEKDGVVVPALAAGGHYDPQATKRHGEPWGDGHLGDLPPLYVESDGSANRAVLAPRLKLADMKNRSLMIHAGGDNHSDHPAPLGGGGARVVCGVLASSVE